MNMTNRTIGIQLLLLGAHLVLIAQDAPKAPTPFPSFNDSMRRKPVLEVAQDGFPAGQASPEGVAVDLARAFIGRDAELFSKTCIPPFGSGEGRKTYEAFLESVKQSIHLEAAKDVPSPFGPKRVLTVFAARHLSLGGPGSYGYAAFNFQDLMFVDVAVLQQNGNRLTNRTLVIKASNGKWYVHPAPHTAPMLSMGLNDEAPSSVDLAEAYEIRRP